jgi:hypothetical protein
VGATVDEVFAQLECATPQHAGECSEALAQLLGVVEDALLLAGRVTARAERLLSGWFGPLLDGHARAVVDALIALHFETRDGVDGADGPDGLAGYVNAVVIACGAVELRTAAAAPPADPAALSELLGAELVDAVARRYAYRGGGAPLLSCVTEKEWARLLWAYMGGPSQAGRLLIELESAARKIANRPRGGRTGTGGPTLPAQPASPAGAARERVVRSQQRTLPAEASLAEPDWSVAEMALQGRTPYVPPRPRPPRAGGLSAATALEGFVGDAAAPGDKHLPEPWLARVERARLLANELGRSVLNETRAADLAELDAAMLTEHMRRFLRWSLPASGARLEYLQPRELMHLLEALTRWLRARDVIAEQAAHTVIGDIRRYAPIAEAAARFSVALRNEYLPDGERVDDDDTVGDASTAVIRKGIPGGLHVDIVDAPVWAPEEATRIAVRGWSITAVALVRTTTGWMLAGRGDVYPHDLKQHPTLDVNRP